MSTGTSRNFSSALFIGGRITPYLSNIAFALSYEPSACSVRISVVSFRTASFIFVGSMLGGAFDGPHDMPAEVGDFGDFGGGDFGGCGDFGGGGDF